MPEWCERVGDGVVLGRVAGDQVVLFETAEGGREDLVGHSGAEGLRKVAVAAWTLVYRVHYWQGPLAVEDVEGWLGVEPVRGLRAWRGRGGARPHRS